MTPSHDQHIRPGHFFRQRAFNVLHRAGITTWSQLAACKASYIISLHGCGCSAFAGIQSALRERGLEFSPEDPPAEEAPSESDAAVKASVRIRDGHRCRKCGLSSEQHRHAFGTDLHVHRLVPGSDYIAGWCVTLCEACHSGMPRNPADIIFKPAAETGVLAVFFSVLHGEDAAACQVLADIAVAKGVPAQAIIKELVIAWAKSQVGDYCI